jgi:hypothetical protein
MSVDTLKQAMLGKAADAPKTNENETQKGITHVRMPPEGRAPGTLNAKWGDTPREGKDGYPDVYSEAVHREAQDGRGDLLDRILDAGKTTAPAEQALMRQVFEHAGEGNPHSPLLQRNKTASVDEPTLTDQVMRVVGHR